MLPKDKDLDSSSIQNRKNQRETNSYQVQHVIRKNRKPTNKLHPKKNKPNMTGWFKVFVLLFNGLLSKRFYIKYL